MRRVRGWGCSSGSWTLILLASSLKWIPRHPPPHPTSFQTLAESKRGQVTRMRRRNAHIYITANRGDCCPADCFFIFFSLCYTTLSLLSFHLFVLVLYELCIHVALFFFFFFPSQNSPIVFSPLTERACESAAVSPE